VVSPVGIVPVSPGVLVISPVVVAPVVVIVPETLEDEPDGKFPSEPPLEQPASRHAAARPGPDETSRTTNERSDRYINRLALRRRSNP